MQLELSLSVVVYINDNQLFFLCFHMVFNNI
jgi:hypothetical protein